MPFWCLAHCVRGFSPYIDLPHCSVLTKSKLQVFTRLSNLQARVNWLQLGRRDRISFLRLRNEQAMNSRRPLQQSYENDIVDVLFQAAAVICGGIASNFLEPRAYDGVVQPAPAPLSEKNPF
jgi:hypothetical protein